MASVQILIQARMNSERFPGKTLYQIKGKPTLGHLLDSLEQIGNGFPIAVLTGTDEVNDPIDSYCTERGIACFRGENIDVAGRFYQYLQDFPSEYFARISADSPLLDHRIVLEAIELIKPDFPDVVTTVGRYGYPSGQHVELVKTKTFTSTLGLFNDARHYEHVTSYFYENPGKFSIKPIEFQHHGEINCKLSFDNSEDLSRIEGIFTIMQRPHYTYHLAEKLAICEDVLR